MSLALLAQGTICEEGTLRQLQEVPVGALSIDNYALGLDTPANKHGRIYEVAPVQQGFPTLLALFEQRLMTVGSH